MEGFWGFCYETSSKCLITLSHARPVFMHPSDVDTLNPCGPPSHPSLPRRLSPKPPNSLLDVQNHVLPAWYFLVIIVLQRTFSVHFSGNSLGNIVEIFLLNLSVKVCTIRTISNIIQFVLNGNYLTLVSTNIFFRFGIFVHLKLQRFNEVHVYFFFISKRHYLRFLQYGLLAPLTRQYFTYSTTDNAILYLQFNTYPLYIQLLRFLTIRVTYTFLLTLLQKNVIYNTYKQELQANEA